MPPQPFLTSAGWSLSGLVTQGRRFHEIPRVSVSDRNLTAIIRKHETSGVPLVIEGMCEHQAWPTAMFDIQWLRRNIKRQIQVRNVLNRRDLDVSFEEFMNHIGSTPHHASAEETSRWYAKDVECPHDWKEWLDTTSLIPRSLCPHGTADIMQNLPENARVETLMCYLGSGDTFTPCHKDLCASFGHNLMCYTEDGASAFWFMTESSAALPMARYFQSLGQELDLESHAMSVEEFAAAPCSIYITEQKAGDLVLVPPRSCHQVVNHGGLTVKMSWSRMTIESTQVALHHELPIYRRVCRVETYRIKSTIHHTLRRSTALLEDLAKAKDGSASYHDVRQKHLANDVQMLLEPFREIILDEYHPDAEFLDHVVPDFNYNVYDTEGYPTFSCDFCGSDIFVSFFCCKGCSLSAENSSGVSDGLHICPGCYAEGRSCRCERPMDPVQCWPLQILYADYNRAVQALRGVGVDKFNEIEVQRIADNNGTGVFEAGTTIQKWRTEFIAKDASQCYAKTQPHAAPTAVILPCKKCRRGRCFVHLAEAGIHSSEAVVLYNKSLDHGPWHTFHMKRASILNKETILAAEESGDSFSNLMGQRLALAALSFQHCQPLNIPYIKLGWYDRVKPNSMAALGLSNAMDMSHPRDSDGWGDWGSPLTEISPEDSVSNTLVRAGTPPRGGDSAKSGLSGPPTPKPSTPVTTGSMKRKRPGLVFDGVAPPERKRKINVRPSAESPPRIPPPTSVNRDEKIRGHQSTQSTTAAVTTPNLEVLIQATSRIESLATAVAEQNRRIEVLVQDNTDLRDEIRNLSQTFQRSKRDIQMVENTINKMTVELKTKFEKTLEKTEGRIQGPIDRLLEELGRMRANPPAPVHVSGITTFPPNTPFSAEPATEGEGSWAPREDYIPAGFNKSHYQDNYEHHGQPSNNYGRGNFRRNRGRGRPPRGGYSGNRTYIPGYIPSHHLSLQEGFLVQLQTHPSTPTATPLQPAPLTPAPAPVSPRVSTAASTLRRDDSYRSQGHAPPPQHPHAQPRAPSYPHSTPPTHPHPRARTTQTDPPTPPPPQQQQQRYRPYARPQAYDRDRDSIRDVNRDRDRRERPPSPLAPREHYADHAPPQPPQPQPPRSREYAAGSYSREDDRPRGGAAAAQARSDPGDDVYPPPRETTTRYADPYAGYSPVPSEEQLRWTPSDSVGQQQQQPQPQHNVNNSGGGGSSRSLSLSRSPSGGSRSVRSPSPGRGYARRGPAEDGRSGRR